MRKDELGREEDSCCSCPRTDARIRWYSHEKDIARENSLNIGGVRMKCAECGTDMPEDSIYCLVCSRKVGDQQSDVASYANVPFGAVLVCPKCGKKNSRTDRWCGSCDADLDEMKKRFASLGPRGPDCPTCGVSSPSGSQYCRKCGTSLTNAPRDQRKGLAVEQPFLILGGSPPTQEREIIRERQVIMIRCKYCGTLNGPIAQKCSSCGAQM